MKTGDDIIYIERTLAGDTAAFSVLVDRYQALVYSLVIKILRHREDAEDFTQNIFVKAFLSLDKFRNESCFSTWLCRIAYNTAISQMRRVKPVTIEINEEITEDTYPEHVDDLREIRLQKLQQSMALLSSDDAILISLYYQHGKSMDEIAEITGMSTSNAKVRIHRIRQKLYHEIKKIEQDECTT
ncbi:MAG: sigma-70 family RNA polymerase sigma factor [Bacteroidales bacterium]|jgi:RNA polymerase sigma-70 factor (ECF subfamily)|nr:sigma-70 family RNA polymerase sigma factor [Bacteroidales bacterium]